MSGQQEVAGSRAPLLHGPRLSDKNRKSYLLRCNHGRAIYIITFWPFCQLGSTGELEATTGALPPSTGELAISEPRKGGGRVWAAGGGSVKLWSSARSLTSVMKVYNHAHNHSAPIKGH